MAEVFISYSRKDADFARRLFNQLHQDGRDVWVDWDDIPLTADWWAEICAGIEAADAFVFVISPASIASPVCNLEINHARQQNKRLLPIVRSRADEKAAFATLAQAELDDNMRTTLNGQDLASVARENWQILARYNWIFFDEDTLFEQRYHDLTRIIDTDLEFVREHTRLLVRAKEWDRNARNRSFLLRGEDLLVAENWLATTGSKEPEPSDLHREYIFASRAAERTSQRRLLTGVSAALVVSLILAGAALFGFQNAETQRIRADANAQQAAANAATSAANERLAVTNEARAFAESTIVAQERDRADREAQIALSRQLAAQARDFSNEHTDLALLLSIEGLLRYREARTESAALEVVETTPQLQRYLRGHSAVVRALAVRDDGQVIASGDDNGQVILWNAETGQRIGLALDLIIAVNALHFGADGRQLIISTVDGGLAVWDIETREVVAQLRQPNAFDSIVVNGAEERAEFTPDGQWLVTANMGGTVLVWDVNAGQLVNEISVGTGMLGDEQIDEVAIAPDGSLVAVTTFNTAETTATNLSLTLWNVRESTSHSIPLNAVVGMPLAFAPDNQALAITVRDQSRQPVSQLLDAASGAVKQSLSVGFDPSQIAFSPDNQRIFLANRQGDVTVLDLASGQPLLPATHAHTADITALVVAADNHHFITGSDDTRLALWDINAYSHIARPLAGDIQGVDVAFNADGSLIAVADEQRIEIRRVADGSLLGQPFEAHEAPSAEILFHPTSDILASFANGQASVWNVAGNQAEILYTVQHPDLSSMAFDPKGRWLVTANLEGHVIIWDAENGDLLSEPVLSFGRSLFDDLLASPLLQGIAFSPDGRHFMTNHGREINLWGVDDSGILGDAPLQTLVSPVDDSPLFFTTQYSPDGKLLAASNYNGAITVWNTETGDLAMPPLLGHGGVAWNLAFDPTSRILASGSYQDGLRLWDMTSGDRFGDVLEHGFINSLAFSPALVQDGPVLASISDHGTILRYLNMEAFRAAACARAGLVMTEEEWQSHFGSTPYRVTCPEVALSQADYLALNGETDAAAALLAKAVASSVEMNNAPLSDALCRSGALALLAEVVLPACDYAVSIDSEYGFYYDSRGIARALAGEAEGAVEDFRAFVAWSAEHEPDDSARTQRESWIEALQAGENPFNLETRTVLREQFAAHSPYKITLALPPAEKQSEAPVLQAMTPERLAEKIAEANLPYDPLIPLEIFEGFAGWFLDGAGGLDGAVFETARELFAPGPDIFGLRLLPTEDEGYIAIYQSNAAYINLEEWSANSGGAFALFSLGADETETLTIDGIDVRKFILPDSAYYFFVLDGLQVALTTDKPQATTTMEDIITSMIRR